jgi:hypothetical protein
MRDLSVVAADIRRHWANPSVYVRPYLDAMAGLSSVRDAYYSESGESVVLYFLANASGWRGADARRIKAELHDMLKQGGRPLCSF